MNTKWMLALAMLFLCQTQAGGAAAQDATRSPPFTPEQEQIVQRMIEDAVAKAMADEQVAPELYAPSNTSAAATSSEKMSPHGRCVLGFAPKGCIAGSEEGGAFRISSGAAAAPLVRGSSADALEEANITTEERLAPFGLGMVLYDPSLSFAPAGRSFAGLPRASSAPGVQGDITFSEDGSTASLRFAQEHATLLQRPDAFVAAVDGWSLQISSPVDDAARKRANLATLDGFASGLGVTFEYTRQRSNLQAKDPAALRHDLGQLCKAVGLDENCTYEDAWTRVKSPVGDEAIDGANAKALVKFQRKQFRWLRDYAFRIEASRERFDYLTETLDPGSQYHVGWGIGATAAFVSPSRRWMYLLGADYQKGREGADSAILCPPLGGTGVVTCAEGPVGPPSTVNRKLLSAEMRGNLGMVGYGLRAAHDFESDTTGIDLPIYLLRNAEGALTGGVRLGWSSKDDVVVGIFLSSPFKW